jgi:hypothetical protein
MSPCFISGSKAKAGRNGLITDAFKAEDVWSFTGVLAGLRCLLISVEQQLTEWPLYLRNNYSSFLLELNRRSIGLQKTDSSKHS